MKYDVAARLIDGQLGHIVDVRKDVALFVPWEGEFVLGIGWLIFGVRIILKEGR